MRTTRLFILLLLFKKPIIASAQLVARQERGVWPDWGELFGDGLKLFRGANDMFQNAQDFDTWNTEPQPDTDTTQNRQNPLDSPGVVPASPPSPDASSPTEGAYKIEINNDPSPVPLPGLEPSPPAILPSASEECDTKNINDADCGITIDQLIFTDGCALIDPNQVVSAEVRAQNQAIQKTLDFMNDQNILAGKGGRGLRISMSRICDVYFFAVPLTEKQTQDIGNQAGVKSVRPNQVLNVEDLPENSDMKENDPTDIQVPTTPGSQHKKRDRIVADPLAWEDLRFISTPIGSELSGAYLYYSKAGQDVTVFAVDSGVNRLHNEFQTSTGESSLHEHRINAIDTLGLSDDYDDLGTCRTSKIVGRTRGVARRAKVIVTVVSYLVSSLLDVFVQIGNYLVEKHLSGENVMGYHVMSIMIQWDNNDEEITLQFEQLLNLLIKFFKLIIVVQAGLDRRYRNSDIIQWPATAEARHDIIVVGAVEVSTGRTYLFSRGGPFLSVNAPGMVSCASNLAENTYMRRRGTDVATTLAAGMIAYLLSADDTGPMLRQNPATIPRTVKNFVQDTASYKREDDDFPAIWNLRGT